MKLLLAALCLSCAAVSVGAGQREGGRNGPIRSMFGQLIQSMQQHKSDPLIQRLKAFVEKAGRDPAETKDEMLAILGELKEELTERRSALEAAAQEELDEEEVPKHRKHSSKERGGERDEDELETVEKIQKKVNRAIRLLEGLEPQLVGKLVESAKPSIEKLLMESESDDEEQEKNESIPNEAKTVDGDGAGKVQEENGDNAGKEQRENGGIADKVQEENGNNAGEVQEGTNDTTVEE